MTTPSNSAGNPPASPAPATPTSPAGSTPFERQQNADASAASAPPRIYDQVTAEQFDALPDNARGVYSEPDPITGMRQFVGVTKAEAPSTGPSIRGPQATKLRGEFVETAMQTLQVPDAKRAECAQWLMRHSTVVDDHGEHRAVFRAASDGVDLHTVGEFVAMVAGTDNDLPAEFLPPVAEPEPTPEEAALADSRPLEAPEPRNVTISETDSRDFAKWERAVAEAKRTGGEPIIVPDEPKPVTRSYDKDRDVLASHLDTLDLSRYAELDRIAKGRGGMVIVTTTEADHTAEDIDAARNASRRAFKANGNTAFGGGYGL